MGLLDKFLDAIKLNDDYDDDEEFADDDESTDSADDL
jgi:cell division inhibitor SepF